MKFAPKSLFGLSLLVVASVFALAGCSEILPGLNVRMGSSDQSQYRIVQDASGHYKAVPTRPRKSGAPLPEYRILPITANLITAEEQARQAARGVNAQLPAVQPGQPPPEYRVGPGDIINVTVWDHPELTLPSGTTTQNATFSGQLVASDGTMYYPYVGTFHAAGKTVAQLRKYIIAHLNTYIRNPQVAVRVVSFQSDRVEVTGEVDKPGTITLDNTAKGVLQAIDLAGGLAKNASRRRAILIRDGKRYPIDLAGLLSGNRVVSNPVLQAGDSIHIPDQSRDQVFVLGAVTKRMPIVMEQSSLTLLQALTGAGGLDVTRANGSGVLVFRLADKRGEPASIFTLDLSRPAGVLLAGEFRLQPRDVVYVKATLFAQYNDIIKQILPTVTTVFELHQLTK